MQWNHRTESYGGSPKSPAFDGILLQEWDPQTKALKGPIKNIFAGSPLGLVEGPHLFRKNGWYYLTTAEGGTGYDHAVTMARSRNIDGPYELHPNRHLITSKDNPEAALQRAGHGQYVETPDGQVYHTHLCGRPLPPKRRCTLGRETALQKCVWREDGWLYLENGTVVPDVEVPGLGDAKRAEKPVRSEYSFDGGKLPGDFQWLRTPQPERIFNLTERPGHLRLIGRESIGSWFEQALVARRQEHHSFRAETVVEFAPDTYQQVAGLIHYYNRHKFHVVAVPVNTHLTADRPAAERTGFQEEDIDAALAKLNETFDIDRADLGRLLRQVEFEAVARSNAEIRCADIMMADTSEWIGLIEVTTTGASAA